MFKKLLKKRVKLSWLVIAVAGVFAAFRHDYIACWLVVIGFFIAFMDGSGSENIVK